MLYQAELSPSDGSKLNSARLTDCSELVAQWSAAFPQSPTAQWNVLPGSPVHRCRGKNLPRQWPGPDASGISTIARWPGSRIGRLPKFCDPSALTVLPTQIFSPLSLTKVTVWFVAACALESPVKASLNAAI